MVNQILGLIIMIIMLSLSYMIANIREGKIRKLEKENKTLKEILLVRDADMKGNNKRICGDCFDYDRCYKHSTEYGKKNTLEYSECNFFKKDISKEVEVL